MSKTISNVVFHLNKHRNKQALNAFARRDLFYACGKLVRVENSSGRVFCSFLAQNSEKTHFYTSLNRPQLDFNMHNLQWNYRFTSLEYSRDNHIRQHNGLCSTFIALLSHLIFLDFWGYFLRDFLVLTIPEISNSDDFISG